MSFQLASAAPGGTIPRIVEYPIASGYAESEGALVVVTTGAYVACGADPTLVDGIAITPGGADTSGFNILARKEFPPLFLQAVAADPALVFSALYVGTLPATNDITPYGVIRDSDGLWKVDFSDTGHDVVALVGRMTDAPESQPRVLVKFLAAVCGTI